jgi:hypothetical protein
MGGDKLTLRELLEQQQRALPVSEQGAFLEKKMREIAQDTDKWRSKLYALETELEQAEHLNDGAVDAAMREYAENGANPAEKALTAAPVRFETRQLKASIAKFKRLIEHGTAAVLYCKREARRVADSLLDERADALTKQAVDAGVALAERWNKAEDAFQVFIGMLTELNALDPTWGDRVHRLDLPRIFAEICGMRKLAPTVLETSKMDDVIFAIRRLGARDGSDNPFKREGQERFIRKRVDLHRPEYFENDVSKLQPKSREAFEQGLSRLAESLV